MKNLTYYQLIELAPKDRPFQIEVETGTGKDNLWAFINRDKQINTDLFSQIRINDIDYAENGSFVLCDKSERMFTLIDPRYTKPEVLKVGQKVRIMESARECGDYDDWFDSKKDTIGTIGKIEFVKDYYEVLSYTIDGYDYPHYCVMPVEEEEEKETLELLNKVEAVQNAFQDLRQELLDKLR